MRTAQFMMLCAALGVTFGGCSVPRLPEAAVTAARPADHLVGKNLDALIVQFGPPARSSLSDNDQTTVVWQFDTPAGSPPLTGSGGLYGDGGSPSYVSPGFSPFCRITATVSTATGIVTQASTEESNGTGSSAAVLRRGESVCAPHLRAKSPT
jgi:hypothetical protein